ncbi:MAG TPA: response regulator transcription factor [Firmicutes bacterium]|nr:response regulator transcription factor [Bacillota bacterium]
MSVNNNKKILIIEDEQKLVRLLKTNFESVGFEVYSADNAKSGLAAMTLTSPDLIILDVMLPDEDGITLCRKIREISDIPIIILTAKVRESDKLLGFESGADDYITKPFSSAELIARVKAVLRRSEGKNNTPKDTELLLGNLRISFARRKVYKNDQEIKLTPTEFQLLYHLAINHDRVMLHEELLKLVWGPEYQSEVEYLRAYIWRLRRKIEDDPAHPQIIVSNLGIGYSCCTPNLLRS